MPMSTAATKGGTIKKAMTLMQKNAEVLRLSTPRNNESKGAFGANNVRKRL